MMNRLAAVALVTLTACSQRVYSPPSQSFALGPLAAMPHGQQAVDVEVASHSQIFDPPLNTLAGRYRTGVGDDTEVSLEGTTMHLDAGGDSPANRTIYAGRVGLRKSAADGVALFGGVGGGYAPAGGGFSALDGGIQLGIENCVIVPVIQASAFVSQPLDPRPIDVGTGGDMTRDYDTPSRTVGGVVRGGLRLSLSPAQCRRGEQAPWLYAGVGITGVADHDSDDSLLGAGLGIQVPL